MLNQKCLNQEALLCQIKYSFSKKTGNLNFPFLMTVMSASILKMEHILLILESIKIAKVVIVWWSMALSCVRMT